MSALSRLNPSLCDALEQSCHAREIEERRGESEGSKVWIPASAGMTKAEYIVLTR
jgi:hypothetical protein